MENKRNTPTVIMSGTLKLSKGVYTDDDSLYWGDCIFDIPNIGPIPIGFEQTSWNKKEENDYIFITFDTSFNNLKKGRLDSFYNEDYKELGIKLQDITAPLLAKTDRIDDYYILVEKSNVKNVDWDVEKMIKNGKTFEILDLTFSDGIKDFEVSPHVIKEYNQRIQKENK